MPTSMAMVWNFFNDLPGGIVSNWYLAGNHNQDRGSGTWPHSLAADNFVPASRYTHLRWDADLIPSAPFTSYVKLVNRGFNLKDLIPFLPDIDIPPRPVELGSTTTLHAFVSVGSDDNSIWLHDSSGAFTGTPGVAIQQTWAQFRTTAIDGTTSDELYTLVFSSTPKPENERRGSIEIRDGQISFARPDVGQMTWKWDGDPYDRGYYYDDPSGGFADHAELGNSSRWGDTLNLSFQVDNVTAIERNYTLIYRLTSDGGETVYCSDSVNTTVAAYTRGSQFDRSFDTGNCLPNVAGYYNLQFWLYQNGVLQDAKIVEFHQTAALFIIYLPDSRQ
ncbi:MAG: hypothetical protein HY335_03720 [Deinococcus sp.]|nr:hypothetical protein [Deinococcus sp.]